MTIKIYLGIRKLSRKGNGFILCIPKAWESGEDFSEEVRVYIVGSKLILEPERGPT